MAIENTTLTSTPAEIITDQVSERAVTVIYLYNIDTDLRTVNLHAVPSGDTPSDGNKFYGNLAIEPGDTYVVDTEKLLLDNGDTLWASSDGTVIATISYAKL
jgi:hypothetical protein